MIKDPSEEPSPSSTDAGSNGGHPPPSHQPNAAGHFSPPPPASSPPQRNAHHHQPPPPQQFQPQQAQHQHQQTQDHGSSADSVNGGGSKRKRVSLACNACRLRKSKCDGVRPKCSMCRDLDFDCVYQQSASSANTIVGKDYIGRLETRLLAVENLLAAQSSMVQLRNSTPSTVGDGTPDGQGHGREQEEHVQRQPKRVRMDSPNGMGTDVSAGETFVNLKQSGLEDDGAPDTVLDGMGALNLGDEEDYGYFGPSSNIAFIGHVTRALASSGTLPAVKDLRHAEPSVETSSRQMSPRLSSAGSADVDVRPGHVILYVLPPEQKVRHFITLYFQNANVLYPYLHQPTFIESYEAALKEGFSKVQRTWLATLNLVMAMGSRTSTEQDVSTEEKYKTAEVFYQRGYGLCNEQLLKLASLESVQLLLLMCHYLQSTRKPVQCWAAHGMAIRIALQMGLHSTQALQRFPPLERELRKRAWYGCVLLERTLCMTFGRPSAMAAYADKLELPLDVEDDALKANMMTPTMVPVSQPACTPATFFIQSIKLYKLLGLIIDTLYGGNLGCSDPSEPTFTDVARVAEIEESLSKWRQELPAALSIVSASDIPAGGGPPSQFWRQSIILSLRYYNTRALLHRQFVVKGLSEIWGAGPSTNKFEGDFFWTFGLASIQVCCDSALETVEIIHKVKHRSDLLGFWWFTQYYTFNASLVLVSKVLIVCQVRQLAMRRDRWDFDTEGLLKHLDMAMETMEVLATGNRIAHRCQLFLKNLMHYVAPLAAASPRALQSQIAQQPHTAPAFDRIAYSAGPGTPMSQQQHNLHQQQQQPTPTHMVAGQQPAEGYMDTVKSPFRAQLGEFMLESDFTYLHSILPPLGMTGDMGAMEGYAPDAYAGMGFGA